MENKKTNKIAILFIIFMALVILGTSVAIYNTPSEVVGGTAGNYTINLTNGGKILYDDGFLFYTKPHQKGIYRIQQGKLDSAKKLTENGDGNLQVIDNTYFFTDGNSIIGCDWDGQRQKVLVEYAKNPLVVGSLIFYLDEQGNLKKYSMQNESSSVILDKSKGVNEFFVYYKRIYYTDSNGNIRKVGFDGNNDKLFVTANATSLSLDGQYIFYIENGSVYSVMLKEKQILKAKITSAEQYAVFGSQIAFCQDGKVKLGNINDIVKNNKKAKVIYEKPGFNISIDEEGFYFFTDENKLMRFTHDGKNKTELN